MAVSGRIQAPVIKNIQSSGQMFDIASPATIIDKLKSCRSVRIFMPDMPASFCAAKIITSILHKELVRFEVDFQPGGARCYPDLDFHVFIDLDPGECRNALSIRDQGNSSIQGNLFTCTCRSTKINSCTLSYSLAKAMNYITSDILWPMIMCFDFYRIFTKNTIPVDDLEGEGDFLGSACNGCRELYADVILEIQKAGPLTDVDGIYHISRPCISFLNFASLFSALQNDIPFIIDKKIYCKKDKKAEGQRIHEYLARKGISRESSCELYTNLGYSTKTLIESHFRRSKSFVKKIGHGIEVSSIENFFLVCYHLLRNSRVDAFLCLSSREAPSIRESIGVHHNLVWIYRDCLANLRRFGDVLLFRISVSEALKDMDIGVLLHLYEHYFDMYIGRKHSHSLRHVIVLEGYLENRFVVATDDPLVASELGHAKERLGGYAVTDRSGLQLILTKLKARPQETPSASSPLN